MHNLLPGTDGSESTLLLRGDAVCGEGAAEAGAEEVDFRGEEGSEAVVEGTPSEAVAIALAS